MGSRTGSQAVLGMMCTAASSLSACATISGVPAPYQDRAAVLRADKPYLSADVRTDKDADTKPFRDRVIYARLEVIDLNYYDFEAKLLSAGAGANLGADLAILTLNGLGATTGAAPAKAAFAAASAGVVGAKGAINTDVFYQKTLPALIAQMRADRQTLLVRITAGIQKPPSEYSLSQALADVDAYYAAGSLPSALTAVTSQAGNRLSSANAQLDLLRSVSWIAPVKGSTAARILAWLYPGGDETKPVNAANLAALTSWMQNYQADPMLASIPYQNLLTGSGLASGEADRIQAIKDLNIPEVTP